MPFPSSLPCRDNGPLRAHMCIEGCLVFVWVRLHKLGVEFGSAPLVFEALAMAHYRPICV